MFIEFMSLHILLCDEVLPYFLLRVEVVRSLNLNLNQKNLNLYKGEFMVNPANPANPTRDNRITHNPIRVKGFVLSQLLKPRGSLRRPRRSCLWSWMSQSTIGGRSHRRRA
jgi:hypothetical protein